MGKLRGAFQWTGVFALGLLFTTIAEAKKVKVKVVNIVDGDTIHVINEKGKKEKIRFLGIDTPELHFNGKSQKPWGQKATDHLHKLLGATQAKVNKSGVLLTPTKDKEDGGEIEVELELGEGKSYDRSLAWIYKEDVNINLQLVVDGFAMLYPYCTVGICDHKWADDYKVEEFIEACKDARDKKIGIWNPKNRLKQAPWEFRRSIDGKPPYQYIGDYETKKLYYPHEEKKVDPCVRIRFQSEDDARSLGYKY